MNKDKLLCKLCGRCFSWGGELSTHQAVNHTPGTSQTAKTDRDTKAQLEKLSMEEAETSKRGGTHDLDSLDINSRPDITMKRGKLVEAQAYHEDEGLPFNATSANIEDPPELSTRVSNGSLDKGNPPSPLLEASSSNILFTYNPYGIEPGTALSQIADFGRNPANDQSIQPRVCGSSSYSNPQKVSQHDLDLINGYKNMASMFFADENFDFEEEGEYGW